jgi:hypothetical protein
MQKRAGRKSPWWRDDTMHRVDDKPYVLPHFDVSQQHDSCLWSRGYSRSSRLRRSLTAIALQLDIRVRGRYHAVQIAWLVVRAACSKTFVRLLRHGTHQVLASSPMHDKSWKRIIMDVDRDVRGRNEERRDSRGRDVRPPPQRKAVSPYPTS